MKKRKILAVLLSLSLAVSTAGLAYSTETCAEENTETQEGTAETEAEAEETAAQEETAETKSKAEETAAQEGTAETESKAEETAAQEGTAETESKAEETAAQEESTESLTEDDLDGNCVEGEILIVYEDEGLSEKKADKLQDAAEQDLKEDCDIENVEEVTGATENEGTVVKAEISDDTTVEEAIEDAESVEGVAYAQPNYVYKLVDDLGEDVSDETELEEASEDAKVSTQATSIDDEFAINEYCYYLTDANITKMWDYTKTNGSQTVAVFDTGCNYNHPDLKNNVLTEYAYDAYHSKKISGTVNTMTKDETDHGTHVCGLIAAEANNGIGVAGTSYNAKVLPVKVFDDDGEYTTSAILSRSFRYLEKLLKNGSLTNCHVLNLSLGFVGKGGNDTTIHNWIRKMKSTYNILTVAAGGNTGTSSKNKANSACYPADWSECMSVAWHDKDGSFDYYSDKNRYKDISAPGNKIASLGSEYAFGEFYYGYVYMRGSSMAAPIVSGVCAALFAYNPSATVSQVHNAIKQSGKSGFKFSDSHGSYSIKRLNASAAVKYLKYAPKTMRLLSVKKGKTAIKANWTARQSGVTGYQVQYAKNAYYNSAKTVTVKDSSASSSKVTGLSKKTTYYVRIRAYYTVNGKNYFSAWSSSKKVKTKS